MASQPHLWAHVPTGRTTPLPEALTNVVHLRGPDPLRCQLKSTATASQALAFSNWWATLADTFHLSDATTAKVATAWLARAGQDVSFDREASYDAAAISALWFHCDETLPALPALKAFNYQLEQVARACRTRNTHAVLRMSTASYPTTNT